jgi:hypothetical protein
MTRRSKEQIDVDSILAGWGIDGLIAQRFLGWAKGSPLVTTDTDNPYGAWWHPPGGGQVQAVPPKLSEDMNLTWDVVEALFALGWKFGMTQNADKQVVIMFVPIGPGYDPDQAIKVFIPSVKMAPLGICRAALLVSAEILATEEDKATREFQGDDETADEDESSLVVM